MEEAVGIINSCSLRCVALSGEEVPVKISINENSGLVITELPAKSSVEVRIPLEDILFVKKNSRGFQLASMTFPRKFVGHSCFCSPCGGTSSGKDRVLMEYRIKCTDPDESREEDAIDKFVKALNTCVFGYEEVQPRKTFVIINPESGQGTAVNEWNTRVKPLLEDSGKFEYIQDPQITTHKMHACKIGKDLSDRIFNQNDDSLNFLVILGGDGVVFEVLNGIYFNYKSPSEYLQILKRIVLCPLPCGSGNGLCFSGLCLANEPFTMNCALRLLIRQKTQEKDLGLIDFEKDNDFDPNPPSRIFSLTISWGLVADVDINSEFLRRFFGEYRFSIYGFIKVIRKKTYEGSLSWRTPPTHEDYHQEIYPDYLTVYASLAPVAARTVVLDPFKSMCDGTLLVHRLLGNEISRIALVSALDELALRRDHVKHIPGFDPIKTSSFELVPSLDSSAVIVVDGERLTKGPVKVRVLPRATHVLSSSS